MYIECLLILFAGLWIVADMMTHCDLKYLNTMRHLEPDQEGNDRELVWFLLCNILGWLRQESLPYPRTDPESVACLRQPVLLVFWHTVGRVWGACWGAVLISAELGTGWVPSLSGQRVLRTYDSETMR